ncbi:2459_t:CDS:2 [Ambispora gerdemannii]|uniref:2459_t:CDS:1 n=1 Tax=Ambispora gerdemannii TaxID=144530 RepID=A0A9N8VCZ7_9GLOM|nr:2459_t:CDS:2 [Ambispora gerdemannii]
MPFPKNFKLNTGATIPTCMQTLRYLTLKVALGLRTPSSRAPPKTLEATKAGLTGGVRYIVSEYANLNEGLIGQAIKESNIPRADLFISGKLWNTRHRDVEKAFNETLSSLGVDYLDLYIMHWPIAFKNNGSDIKVGEDHKVDKRAYDDLYPKSSNSKELEIDSEVDFLDTWKQMEALLPSKKVKAIGVANYTKPKLEKLLKNSKVIPALLEIETHPFMLQTELMEYCKKNKIHVSAHTSTGLSNKRGVLKKVLVDEPVIKNIAEKHEQSPFKVLAAWAIQRGTTPVLPAIDAEKVKEVFDLKELTKEEFEEIRKLGDEHTERYFSANGFSSVFEDKE